MEFGASRDKSWATEENPEILGGDRLPPERPGQFALGISRIRRVPRNDRKQANYRFYCDNDPQDPSPDSKGRWRLRPDPAGLICLPTFYKRQRDRPRWEDATREQRRRGQFQEWEDVDNGILTDRSCQNNPATGIMTYKTPSTGRSSSGQNPMRSTITVCWPRLTLLEIH